MADDALASSAKQSIAVLAAAARLPLTEERIAIVAEIIDEWTPGCHTLNALMSAADRLHVVPITVLTHST